MLKKIAKVTYLLGAGASYNALPIVSEIPDEVENMLKYISLYEAKTKSNNTTFVKTLELIKQIKQHYSVDTLARKFWLAENGNFTNENYVRLKNIITCLIIFGQIEKWNIKPGIDEPIILKLRETRVYKLDTRYDAFFSAILKKDLTIPININFISWNYDFQIEKAFQFYSKQMSIWEIGTNILGVDYNVNKSNSQIIKVNGTAIFVNGVENKIDYTEYTKVLHEIFVRALSDNLDIYLMSGIKFAWEPSELAQKKREQASSVIAESDYVVVIGYSFPIFNREVDLKMFENFKGKIVIQDIDGRAQEIQNQLEAIKRGMKSKSSIATNLDNYYMPPEYWSGMGRGPDVFTF